MSRIVFQRSDPGPLYWKTLYSILPDVCALCAGSGTVGSLHSGNLRNQLEAIKKDMDAMRRLDEACASLRPAAVDKLSASLVTFEEKYAHYNILFVETILVFAMASLIKDGKRVDSKDKESARRLKLIDAQLTRVRNNESGMKIEMLHGILVQTADEMVAALVKK